MKVSPFLWPLPFPLFYLHSLYFPSSVPEYSFEAEMNQTTKDI